MFKFASAVGALSLLASNAAAQVAEGSPASPAPTNYVSVGAAMLPDYAGSDDYRVIPFGAARFDLAGLTFRTDGPGLAAILYDEGPVEAGVYARWSGGRNDVEDAIVSRLPEVDSSILTGGYVQLSLAQGVLTERDQVGIGARVGVDALNRFGGAVWSVSANYGAALSRGVFVALSASVNGVSDDYADTLFSVDAAGAAASGLAVFDAGAGVQDIGVTAVTDFSITRTWSVTTVLGYSRLVGDFADSPIVAVRGDENQAFAGLSIGRRF